jgi:hypothetical protein
MYDTATCTSKSSDDVIETSRIGGEWFGDKYSSIITSQNFRFIAKLSSKVEAGHCKPKTCTNRDH